MSKLTKALLALSLIVLSTTFSFAQNNFSKVDIWLADNLKDIGGRGVIVIWKDGKIIYNNADNGLTQRQKMVANFLAKRQGKDAAEATKDFTSTTKERIASCSKWLTAALVMTFVDEGKLSLEDTVGKFLPMLTQTGKGSIKIWQCLSHLTGINSPQGKESWTEFANFKTMDDAVSYIAKQPMEGEPGKTFHYGNTGLQIAAAIVEKLGKKNFEALFQERIAKPCGMKQTDFGKAAVVLAAGGAFSTAEDYINFMVMLLNDGKFNNKQVLSKKSVFDMQQNYKKDATIKYSPEQTGTNWGYGFGEWTMDDDSPRSNAVSSPGLFGTFPWIDNERKYVAILFSFNVNNKGRQERYRDLKTLVDAALSK